MQGECKVQYLKLLKTLKTSFKIDNHRSVNQHSKYSSNDFDSLIILKDM